MWSDLELDAFGDLIPEHLRKSKRSRKRRQVYRVQEEERKSTLGVEGAGEEWNTDF